MTKCRFLGVLAAAGVLVTNSAQGAEILGAGSTFVAPVLAKWSAEYGSRTGTQITYQSIGSGAGLQQIKAGAVDFGASDAPLKPDELRKLGLGQFPIVIGGIVPVVNIEGIRPGQIRFTGQLLADIYLGRTKNWSDPEIAKLNPGISLPGAPITLVHRSDGSGTTFNFVNYLSKLSPEWRRTVGEGTAVEWPLGAGGRGNDGVAAYVSRTKNSIGYVEFTYALESKLTYGLVQNKAGRFVTPNAESFQAAAQSADWSNAQDFYLIMTDAPGEAAYPIAATAFILMHKAPRDPGRSKVAIDFFRWALENGQRQASELHYVPLPADLVQQIGAYWQSQFSGSKKGR